MKNIYKLFLFLSFLTILQFACSISKNSTPIPVPPKTIISPIATVTCTIPVPPKKIGVVNVDIGLNLREESNENSKSLYILKNGDTLEILGNSENGWLCVKFTKITDEGKTIFYSGYVNPKYVEIK